MAKRIEDRFSFWCPIEKSKTIDPTTGDMVMRLGGIASTADEDSDGEFLDPKGFDIKPLLESGMVNWHHQAKGQPATIIGEPSKAELRPEGLYVEVDLYPSSKIAQDVWELAETLEKDSKSRRLGYSIEGKVVKRKSDDPKSPNYKKVDKAIITGLAVTHQPKNPKTFANIIKGDVNDFDDEVEEAIDTEKDEDLKKESVDKKLKPQNLTKAETIERLFKYIPSIKIEKAEKVYIILKKLANMKGRNAVTDEDIQKACDVLGVDITGLDIKKGAGYDTEGGRSQGLKKAKGKMANKADEDEDDDGDETEDDEPDDEEDDEDQTQYDRKTGKVIKKAKKAEDDEEDDDYEDEEEVDEREAKLKEREGGVKGDYKLHKEAEKRDRSIKKGGYNRFDSLEKAIVTSHAEQSNLARALGVMVKSVSQKADAIMNSYEALQDVVKAQESTILELSERLEAFGAAPGAPKSLSAARPVQRVFAKGNDNDFGDNAPVGLEKNQVSLRDRKTISNMLDYATFAKGYDQEFSKACVSFEAKQPLPGNIVSRLKNEFGIEIVK